MYADSHRLIYYNCNYKPIEASTEKQSGRTSTKSTTHNESLIIYSANGSRIWRISQGKYLSGWTIISKLQTSHYHHNFQGETSNWVSAQK